MKLSPFDQFEGRRELADRLGTVNPDLQFGDDKLDGWPFSGRGALIRVDQIEAFLTVWDWYLDQLKELEAPSAG